MPYREMQAWIVLGGCLMGLAYFCAKLSGWLDRLDVPWLWIGASVVLVAALFWTLARSEPTDERDMLIQLKSLSLAARIFIFGLLGVMLFSGGGSEGTVSKTALFCLMAVAGVAAAGRGLYLYRYTA